MSVLKWRENNGSSWEIEGESADDLVEIGRIIYETTDSVNYVCVLKNGEIIKEWIW